MEKKDKPNKRNPVSDADLNDGKFNKWIQAQLTKEAEEIEKSLEEVPDTDEWNPTEEKFQALMQKARDRGLHISSNEDTAENTDDFDDRKNEKPKLKVIKVKEKTEKEEETTYPAGKKAAGWRRKKAIQWIAAAAVTAIGIFGVSMSSQANRAYIMQEVNKVLGNDVNTEIDNNIVEESDRTEEYVREEIESKLGVKMPRFYYLPEGMKYDSYTIDEEAHTAIMLYTYNERVVYFLVVANNESATGGSQNDLGKKLYDVPSKYTTSLNIELWEIMEDEDPKPTYALQWKYLNCYYEIFGKIPETEISLIAEKIMY